MTNRPSILDLNDIVEPAAPTIWPLTPVLSALLLLLAIALLAFTIYRVVRWVRNAYRREALRQLENASDSAAIMVLLKRVALVSWPRETVAPLYDDEWLEFLNGSCTRCRFEKGAEVESLRRQAVVWIRFHRGEAEC